MLLQSMQYAFSDSCDETQHGPSNDAINLIYVCTVPIDLEQNLNFSHTGKWNIKDYRRTVFQRGIPAMY